MSDIIERNTDEWIKREEELLHQITNLIQINDNVVATNDEKLKTSNDSLSKLSIENELLKKKLAKLEVELEETKSLSKSQVMTQVKEKYEDILLKAKNLLFENQKTMQNQQVQLEAYKAQTVRKSCLNFLSSLLKYVFNRNPSRKSSVSLKTCWISGTVKMRTLNPSLRRWTLSLRQSQIDKSFWRKNSLSAPTFITSWNWNTQSRSPFLP